MIGTKSEKQSTFAAGAMLLVFSAIVVKIIGVCYKIPLVHLLGAQGMGYFNAAYDVYALLCVISTTGLPVAVSVLVNRYPKQRQRIFGITLVIFSVLGLSGAAGVFLGADRIATWVGAPQAALSLRFIAPAVLFVCISGAFKGYYQAKRNMMPTAVSQVIEAAGKLLFGLLFAHIALRSAKGAALSAAFAVLGLSVGTFLSMIYLIMLSKRERDTEKQSALSDRQLIKQLLIVAFPVTMGAVLSGLSKIIDLSLIMRRLQDAGMAPDTAVSLYGCYSAMVIPLFNAIPMLFSSLAMPLVSHLGHAIAKEDRAAQKQILNTAFRWCAAFSIPAALGLGMMSRQALQILFSDQADIQTSVPLLVCICMSVPASCMITASNAVLQAYGHAWLPMISTAIGCVIKAISLYALCILPGVGILAAPISTLLCCTLTVCINLMFMAGITPSFGLAWHLIRSLIVSGIAIGAAALLYRVILHRLDFPLLTAGIAVAVAVLLYLPIAYKCGLISTSDIKSITKQKEKEI